MSSQRRSESGESPSQWRPESGETPSQQYGPAWASGMGGQWRLSPFEWPVERAAAMRGWLGTRRWVGGGNGSWAGGMGGGACTSEMVGAGQARAATRV
jgi:hypothetical protein